MNDDKSIAVHINDSNEELSRELHAKETKARKAYERRIKLVR